MISSDLLQFICSVRDQLVRDIFQTEAAVREMIVLPVLGHLGWPLNPLHIRPEHSLGNLKVDYGLMISENSSTPRCIIEVKALGNLANADRQLFEYAYRAGAPIAVLTDGKQWMIYLSIGGGEFQEKLVRTFDFTKHDPEEIAKGLDRYLSFDNTCSEQARRNAEHDRDKRITKDMAKKQIPVAWENLLKANSDRLINLLIEETSQFSEYPPARSDVEEFLKNLENAEFKPKPKTARRKKPEPQKPELRKRAQSSSKPEKPQKKSGNETQFILLGGKYSERTAAKAYARIMKILAARDKDFTMRLAPLTAGKKKKWLSQNREDMVKIKMSEEISPGWWLDTNLSNESKIKRLEMACKIAGIPFGKPVGLKITFQSKN